jgi:aminoglycoside phosphotransferase
LEYLSADGEIIAARRFGRSIEEKTALSGAAQELGRRGDLGTVGVMPELGMLLLRGGADLRLRPLARLLTADGAGLLAHRAERRAVVRRKRGRTVVYAKVVPPSRVEMQVRRASAVAEVPIRVPRLLGVRLEKGLTTWSALPGRPLGEVIGEDPRDVGRRVGEMTRALHDFVPSVDLPIHGPGDEMSVVEEWVQRLAGHFPAPALSQYLAELATGLGEPPTHLKLIHRDLHDGQILVDDNGEAGLLDLDTLSLGDAALDLANLLVHLELGVLLGSWSVSVARRCAEALLDGYAPTEETMRRIVPYAAAARLRLVCVYAFRPGADPTGHLLESMWRWPVAVGDLIGVTVKAGP